MKTKKILSMILALLMMIVALPLTSLESNAYSNYETESNDTYASADVLPLNSSIGGCMNDGSDVDVYKITTSQNGKLSLTFTHKYVSGSACWTIIVYQYKDGQYTKMFDYQRVYTYDKETYTLIPIGVVAGGTYYIEIFGGTYDGGGKPVGHEYGLESSLLATEYYEKEFNGSYDTATKMSLNKTYKGCMNDSRDVDIYKVTTSQNGKLSLTFTHKYVGSGSACWSINVYLYKDGQYTRMFDTKLVYTYDQETYTLTPIGAVAGGVYYIMVAGSTDVSGLEYGLTVSDQLPKPTPKVANKNGYVSITWSKSAGAKGYYVYRKAPGETSWKRIADVTGTSYNDKNVKSGTNYTYTVKAYNGSTYSSYHSGVTIKYLAQPIVKTANKNGSVSITWSKTAGAKGYYIYRKAPGETSWKRITDVTGTSYNDKNVKSGTNYTYTVKAYNGSTYSSYHSGVAIKYLAQPTVKTANKNGSVAITWSKTAGAKGYYVYRKGPNDKSWVRIANVTGTSYNDKNVKKGTKYTYTVKAYNGSYNSAYNAGITVKHTVKH